MICDIYIRKIAFSMVVLMNYTSTTSHHRRVLLKDQQMWNYLTKILCLLSFLVESITQNIILSRRYMNIHKNDNMI